jgi:putative flippase GtrA
MRRQQFAGKGTKQKGTFPSDISSFFSITYTVYTVVVHIQFLKYLCAGTVAVGVNLSVLYVLTEYAHIYYLYSAVCSFLISFCVSFVLQKYWTFRDTTRERVHSQALLYLSVQVTNLALNTTLLYALVTYLHIWYMLSQAIVSLVLATGIFFINKFIIFKKTSVTLN